MSAADIFVPPTVTDADICHVSRLLGLRVDAFCGLDGADPRQKVLKCMDSVDVAACPGSGKTTLLVAKLAVLAEKWQYSTRGICVLSHTNAARQEIEKHLGNTSVGQRILSYPHYIGTIHGFVNEFLALPQLRSNGYGGTRFDSDISGRKILKLSGGGKNLPGFLYRKIKNEDARIQAVSHAHYVSENLDIRLHSGNVNLILRRKKKNSETFKKLNKWKLDILRDGFAAYEDTFAYGHKALEKYPGLVKMIRDRFPILFIDEAQDNSKEQSAILSRIFMDGDSSVIRQRFGDGNQAIFDYQGAEETPIDKFPSAQVVDLSNSHRFGQAIADLADPLGIQPYGLQGLGPQRPLESGSPAGPHTVFLFDKDSASKVLDAYGALLLETFSDAEMRKDSFIAKAVGHRHTRQDTDEDHKFPQHVGHYWSGYEPELTKHDPTPRSFMQYVLVGRGKAELRGESHSMVEKIAEGILRLSDFCSEGKPLTRRKNAHRHILQLLEVSPEIRKQYQDLVLQLTVDQKSPSFFESWKPQLGGVVRGIAEILAGSKLSEESNDFLMWNNEPSAPTPYPSESRSKNNQFSCRKNGREVFIHIGSIHSVKGQTHTATLVLETSWHGHNLEHILPWFTGNSQGSKSADGPRQESRLKLHYVAMTRPTHLLCLAMKQSTLNDEHMKAIQTRGWRLAQVQPDGSTVLLKPM